PREKLAERREEREDEERDRRGRDERADRARRARQAGPFGVRGRHGRLRFHHRAPSGSAGARSSRPRTPSGTIVATVRLDGVAELSKYSAVAQFAASLGVT